MPLKIGFVGVGIMGHGMASNLLEAGHDLTVIAHRNRAPVEDLVARGAKEAKNLEELARENDTVVICVTGTPAAKTVVEGLAPHMPAGGLVIDTTTNAPDGPEHLAGILDAGGLYYVEAPVTGGVQQAKEGVLGAIVGCEEALFPRAEAVLRVFCKQVERFGGVGMGARTKLVSNFLALGTATLVVEAFKLAREQGVDRQKLYDLALLGSGNSVGLQRIVGGALNGDYKGYVFTVQNTSKDLGYLSELIETDSSSAALVAALRGIHDQATASGKGEQLLSELLKPDS